MASSDDLFRLIHSLSKAEKGYFTKYASRHAIGGKNDYLRLFEAIDGMESHDESRLRGMLAGTSLTGRLPAVKHYLYRIVLKSLRAYYDESDALSMLRGELENAGILFKKGLIDQAMKVIERLKRSARRDYKEMILLQAIRYERLLLSERSYDDGDFDAIDRSIEEEEQLLIELRNAARLERASKGIMREVMKRGGTRSEQERRKLETMMSAPILADENIPFTPKSRLLLYHIKSCYAYAIGDFEEGYRVQRKLVELLQTEPLLWRDAPARYVGVVNNLIGICQVTGRFDEAWQWIRSLRELPIENEQMAVDTFTSVWGAEITLLLKLGDFERALGVAQEIDAGIVRFGSAIGRSYLYHFNYHIAWVNIGLGRFEVARQRLHLILNETEADVRNDITCFARILNLVVHYELGHRDLLPYAIRSTYRALTRRDRMNGVESVLLRALRSLADAERDEEIHAIFVRTELDLLPLAEDPSERGAFNYFHFIPWLRSKMEGKTVAEMFAEQGMRGSTPTSVRAAEAA